MKRLFTVIVLLVATAMSVYASDWDGIESCAESASSCSGVCQAAPASCYQDSQQEYCTLAYSYSQMGYVEVMTRDFECRNPFTQELYFTGECVSHEGWYPGCY